nr:MAG TPA: C2H2 type zinc-finger protein [Caudoviricetes sp.]
MNLKGGLYVTIVKCDRCSKTFVSGYAVLVRSVFHSKYPGANVAANQNFLVTKDQYDVCVECMRELLEASACEPGRQD